MIVLVLIDLHVHSTFSGDGESSVEDYCKKAREVGVSEIGFSEHWDFNPDDPGYGKYDYAKALSGFMCARKCINNPKIIFGAEIGYNREYENEIRKSLKGKEFDYIIGSVHIIGNEIISRKINNHFEDKTEDEAYLPYFAELKNAAESGLFNIIGHFDLIKRYGVSYFGRFKPEKYDSEITEILELMVKNNIALEINSSGLRQLPKEAYPSLETIKLYRKLGGELVTVGSDSHSKDSLGAGIKEAIKIAKDAGFGEIASFESGKPVFIKI